MFSNENPHEQIDRYILGEMNAEDSIAFEELLAKDEGLADEVIQQKIMLATIDEHEELLANQSTITSSSENTQRRKPIKHRNTRKNRILSTLGIAISISIITFISTWYIINRKVIKNNLEKRQDFTELDNRVALLEQQIEDLNKVVSKSLLINMPQLSDTVYIPHNLVHLKGLIIDISQNEITISSSDKLEIGDLVINNKNQVIGRVEKQSNKNYTVTIINQINTSISL